MKKDFGAFELHEKIGSGGMASVYLGKQKALDRPVVIKVLYPHLAEDEKLVARFEREARTAAHLRHENIVQVIDCGRFEDLSYIAMEFVEGLNLKQWMETYGAPPIEMALLMLRDICRGIEHAHQNRVVHRDIKPANLMFTPDGAIKIMDFGLARRGEDSTAAVTVVGSVLGTPAYMSPEQATGEQVDERSDIFSAGVVAYELLGGTRPFQGDSYSSVLRAILTVEPPPLESLNPLVPPEVVKIIHRMLAKDVAKRVASMALVRGDLESVVEEMGLLRGRDLLREYAQDPQRVAEVLRKKRLGRHLDQGLYFENMGLSRIDDALLEFRRVLHLDPENKTAKEHVKKLERDRERMLAEQGAAGGGDKTLVLDAAAKSDATLVLPTPGPPAAAPPAPPPAPPAAQPPPAAPARVQPAAPPPKPAARPVPVRPAAPPPRGGQATQTRNLIVAAAAALGVILVVGAVILLRGGGGRDQGGQAGPGGGEPPPAASTMEAPPATTGGETQEPPPAVTTAALGVTTDPPQAKVIVDGVTQSQRSNATFGDLPPGPHTIRVEKDGFAPQEQQVTLAAGQEEKLSFVLQPAAGANGQLEIRVTPFATFFVDGQQVDANKVSTRVSLKPGRYTVRAVHPAFAPKEWKDVLVEPNRVKTLSYDFVQGTQSKTGSLGVGCEGGWAYIYLDGRNTGKTAPGVVEGLASGTYAVSLVREGFVVEGEARTVTVKPGQRTEVSFRIHPK